jgi:hypothetical protein
MKRKIPVILGIIQAFVALGAIPAGLSMICIPDGSGLKMSTDLLLYSPFHDFLIPGIFLFIINGILNLASAILSFIRNKYTGFFGVCLGFFLITWVSVQVYITGLISFMQPLFFFIGLSELLLATLLVYKNIKTTI